MLLIPVEVSLKVACRFTIATDCSHRPTSISRILMEVSVNVAVSPLQPQTAVTELTPCYLSVSSLGLNLQYDTYIIQHEYHGHNPN